MRAAALLLVSLACAAPPAPTGGTAPALVDGEDASTAGEREFLAPNTRDVDGTPAYVHFDPEHMPIRIQVATPRKAARYASREQTQAAIIESIRAWERAIQPTAPWFAFEFVGPDDPDPDIVVEWKRRIGGDYVGVGGIGWEMRDEQFRIRGYLRYVSETCVADYCALEIEELQRLVAHEFGHTLGLMHCLECDSVMNYAWEKRRKLTITPSDVATLRALLAKPNGMRVDGVLLEALRSDAPAPAHERDPGKSY